MQLHVATIDPKSLQRRSSVQPHRDLIEVDVPHLLAALANEMMVMIRIDFELNGGAAALERADQTGAHQFLHVAIHRRVRDRRQHLPDFLDQVVSGGMTNRSAEGVQQNISLRREAQTACDARPSQPGVPIVRRCLRHDRKSTLARAAPQIPRDADTQLIIITIALDLPFGARCHEHACSHPEGQAQARTRRSRTDGAGLNWARAR